MRYILPLIAVIATPAAADVPKVLADIPPVQALVAQVMGNLGTPGLLLNKGGDEHDLQLRPSQMRDMVSAGLVVWVGPELTPGLADAVDAAGTPALALLDQPATRRVNYASGGLNPHAWLDPVNAKVWTGLIAERLAALDPDHAATYRANAQTALAGITALDADLAAELAPIAQKPFLGWHDAYAYYAQHFHLSYLGGLSEGDEAPPGAARLSDISALASAGKIACAFPEAQHDPALLAALPGVKLGEELDPVGSNLDAGPDAYAMVMRGLASTLADCLAP
jgi:zinc transport system substrate-binding protein